MTLRALLRYILLPVCLWVAVGVDVHAAPVRPVLSSAVATDVEQSEGLVDVSAGLRVSTSFGQRTGTGDGGDRRARAGIRQRRSLPEPCGAGSIGDADDPRSDTLTSPALAGRAGWHTTTPPPLT